MPWAVDFHPAFAEEVRSLPVSVQDELFAQAAVIAEFGPTLGRPWVDTLKGSKVTNLKELRFVANDGVWRALFAFDGQRVAVLLAAADKRGQGSARFYKALIRLAEQRRSSWS